jgi:hypothetical protein
VGSSPFRDRVARYVEWWRAQPTNTGHVPLVIHYKSPALDRALIDLLTELAQGKHRIADKPPVHLDLYVTEFQVDADASDRPDGSANTAQETTG